MKKRGRKEEYILTGDKKVQVGTVMGQGVQGVHDGQGFEERDSTPSLSPSP